MKIIFTLVLLVFSGLTRAQSPDTTSAGRAALPINSNTCTEAVSGFQHKADSLLQRLDKTQVPTGILYDRVSSQAALHAFNRANGNADTSNVNHFLQAYYELHAADYRNPHTAPCRQVLRDNARYYAERGQILIGALRYRFNYIDTNAVRNNQLRWLAGPNSQLLDVAGRSSAPYVLVEVAVGAALVDTLRQGGADFRLDRGSMFTNTGAVLTGASIDFGDGQGARPCPVGQPVSVSYGTIGRKTLRYVFNYADGQQFTTYSTLYVARAACTNCRTAGIGPCRETKGFQASNAFQGGLGKADISYFYREINNNLCDPTIVNVKKPVIIIDGFDHEDKRDGADIFNNYLAYVDAANRTANLGSELRTAGYDVVIFNPPNLYETRYFLGLPYQAIARHGGSDHMERNGLTLVSLIQELNRQMVAAGSAEQIVVIGPSMGGQISRYALSYMEANNLPHNTRLYISLDSPHNGANIPIGLQHFIKYFADETKDEQLVNGLDALNSPASRELTQHFHEQGTYFLPDPSRTAFMNAVRGFRPGGFPANLRRIAVTNGALNGARQTDQNGQVINDQDQAFFLEQKGIPPGGTLVTISRVLFFFPSLATRLITTASARVWYAPGQGQTARVLRTYILGTGSHSQEAVGVPNSCGLDGAPGGYRNFFSEVADGNNSSGLFQRRHFFSVRDKAVFIPMLSALAYTPPSYNNCASVLATNLVCGGTTPFDAYYGPADHNEEHIQLTPGNVAFMRNEIMGTLPTPDPVFPNAPNAACAGAFSSATFRVEPACAAPGRNQPGTICEWTVDRGATFSNGLAQISGPSTSQIVSLPSNAAGQYYLVLVRARLNMLGATPSNWVARSVYFTNGTITGAGSTAAADYEYSDLFLEIKSTVLAGGPYLWTFVPNPNQPLVRGNFRASTFTGQQSFAGNFPRFVARGPGLYRFSVAGRASCDGDETPPYSFGVTVLPSGLQTATQPAYPNPADVSVTINLTDQADPTEPVPAGTEVTLYDAQGQIVTHQVAQPGATEIQMSTATTPEGNYNVVVEKPGETPELYHLEVDH